MLLNENIEKESQAVHFPVAIESIDLAGAGLQYCRGCRVCFDKGETYCPFWSEIAPIKAAMQAADIWNLASPVFVDDINGVMKTFLDRMAHINHRPEFAGKYAYLLTTSGTGSSGHAARTMVNTLRTWGVYIVGQRDFVCGALSSPDELKVRYQKPLIAIAEKIINAFINEKALRPSVISLIFFRVQQILWRGKKENNLDYHYWESKGWLEPGINYYLPHKTGLLSVWTARLAGSIIARFFE